MVLTQKESDVQMLLAADAHLGTKNCDFQMERYVWKRRSDGMFSVLYLCFVADLLVLFSLPRWLWLSRGEVDVLRFAAAFHLHRDGRDGFVKLGLYVVALQTPPCNGGGHDAKL